MSIGMSVFLAIVNLVILFFTAREGYRMGMREGALEERGRVIGFIARRSATRTPAQLCDSLERGEHEHTEG